MLAEMREQRPFLTELRHACQHIEPEIAPVELAFAEIAPFDDRDRPGVPPVFWRLLHRPRVAVDEIERKYVRSGAIHDRKSVVSGKRVSVRVDFGVRRII